jgi:hypothetical protein
LTDATDQYRKSKQQHRYDIQSDEHHKGQKSAENNNSVSFEKQIGSLVFEQLFGISAMQLPIKFREKKLLQSKTGSDCKRAHNQPQRNPLAADEQAHRWPWEKRHSQFMEKNQF